MLLQERFDAVFAALTTLLESAEYGEKLNVRHEATSQFRAIRRQAELLTRLVVELKGSPAARTPVLFDIGHGRQVNLNEVTEVVRVAPPQSHYVVVGGARLAVHRTASLDEIEAALAKITIRDALAGCLRPPLDVAATDVRSEFREMGRAALAEIHAEDAKALIGEFADPDDDALVGHPMAEAEALIGEFGCDDGPPKLDVPPPEPPEPSPDLGRLLDGLAVQPNLKPDWPILFIVDDHTLINIGQITSVKVRAAYHHGTQRHTPPHVVLAGGEVHSLTDRALGRLASLLGFTLDPE